jgi:hypothetical protein
MDPVGGEHMSADQRVGPARPRRRHSMADLTIQTYGNTVFVGGQSPPIGFIRKILVKFNVATGAVDLRCRVSTWHCLGPENVGWSHRLDAGASGLRQRER